MTLENIQEKLMNTLRKKGTAGDSIETHNNIICINGQNFDGIIFMQILRKLLNIDYESRPYRYSAGYKREEEQEWKRGVPGHPDNEMGNS